MTNSEDIEYTIRGAIETLEENDLLKHNLRVAHQKIRNNETEYYLCLDSGKGIHEQLEKDMVKKLALREAKYKEDLLIKDQKIHSLTLAHTGLFKI